MRPPPLDETKNESVVEFYVVRKSDFGFLLNKAEAADPLCCLILGAINKTARLLQNRAARCCTCDFWFEPNENTPPAGFLCVATADNPLSMISPLCGTCADLHQDFAEDKLRATLSELHGVGVVRFPARP
jgi:hypothetical protein